MFTTIKESLKRLVPFAAPALSASAVLVRSQRSKHYIQRRLRDGQPVRIELGAGDKRGVNGWLTIDMTRNCDVFWDLRRGLPFPEASVDAIYSSHFFEHLTYTEGQRLLDDCRRVLTPGGSFSICVPNARLYLEAYFQAALPEGRRLMGYQPAVNHTTRIDLVNYIAYMDGHHKYMFDEENLVHLLTARGFQNARRRGFDARLDLPEREYESIYAEAER